ncbi:phosphatase PAP2 family protein [Streptomyces coeruleofuscus]|uniref:phosphatase PAP2 family protein n=1 Tax=Streptomyces coeruleofuscus TaxID=66879 RepID=UPI000A396266
MRVLAGLEEGDRRLTARMASWNSPFVRRVLPAVRAAAEHTRLWCGAAVLLSVAGGGRGREAALTGLASMAVAELVSNAVAKPLQERPRPPKEWIPHDDVDDRPRSSSFPSGHTAAAVAFTSAVAPTWPRVATACAVPAVMVAAERVHRGAHYASDVAAGAAIGLASSWFTRHAPRLIQRHWPQ